MLATPIAPTTQLLNNTYLRLDASNDPLTGTLTSRAIEPSADATYALGTSSLRFTDVAATRLRIVAGAGAVTQTNNGSIFGVKLSQSGTGTATIKSESISNYAVAAGGGVEATGAGAAEIVVGSAIAGGGSFGFGVVTTESATVKLHSTGLASFGVAYVEAFNSTLGDVSEAKATGHASFMVAKIIATDSLTGTANASGAGSSVQGVIDTSLLGASAAMTASARGASARGYASGASIIASSDGATAGGYANGFNLEATGQGAGAFGMATGQAIIANATNAFQFGPGTNALATSLKVGSAGLRLKGTTGAPGTPVNGDIYLGGTGNAFVTVRSNAKAVQINTGAAGWTVGGFATRRSFTGVTAVIGPITTAGYTLDSAIQAATNVTPWGFANQNEADTFINVVANLQTRLNEAFELIETLAEELQTANHIN